MDFSKDYLTKQIIAYIGNKRKLLSLIYKAIENTGLDRKSGLKFFDVFAGSGVVSRFAKSLGFEVFTNDWEYYSFIINSCYLGINKSDIKTLFGSEENFLNLLDKINNLPEPKESEQYIAKYYAPKNFDINNVDYKTERLFYTKENALIIDKIRNYIEAEYPLENISENNLKIRNLLLANLIYEAATHTNTSGVFKACHKGFGGHGKDALKRITEKIKLSPAVLKDSNYQVHIFQEDANILVNKIKNIDIAYLDPPYNQHQYGSNYHLLNTIAKWDKIPAELELDQNGQLKEKAAIRHDWIETRSPYCYKKKAVAAFEKLIENIDAKRILISYSTDGIIPFEEMQKICMKKGDVTLVTNEYTTYRGGKQSNNRQNTNIEFILCINTEKKASSESLEEIEKIFIRKKISLLFKQKFLKDKLLLAANQKSEDNLIFHIKGTEFEIKTHNCFTLEIPENFGNFPREAQEELFAILNDCVCKTKEEELAEIFYHGTLDTDISEDAKNQFIKQLPSTLKKLAHKKNKATFEKWLKIIKDLEKTQPQKYELINKKIETVEKIAEQRFFN